MDIEDQIRRLRDQVRSLGELLDSEEHALLRFMLQNNWGDDELSDLRAIFHTYEEKLKVSQSIDGIEKAFYDRYGDNRHVYRSAVLALYQDCEFVDVCKAIAIEQYPAEFAGIRADIKKHHDAREAEFKIDDPPGE